MTVPLLLAGCRKQESLPADARTAAVDAQVRAKWGKGLGDLPAVKLVLITANNENIQKEFEWAFVLHHALEYGQRVEFDWRDVGGGGSAIEKYLLSIYENPLKLRNTCDIDVLWGGGDFMHMNLAKPTAHHPSGLLEPLNLSPELLAQVPAQMEGNVYLDKDRKWIGSAISGFGILYNAAMLRKIGVQPPSRWEDLAAPEFADLLTVADPDQSTSAAGAYRTIVLTERTWPAGWAKLLNVLANCKRFTDSAGSAANSPVLGDSLVATCIDFFGINRVTEAPDQLAYISPAGETTFSADPIAILLNPPNRPIAQRFVNFVMSARGQALWALRVGEKDGPVHTVLGRQPIRRDVYENYAAGMDKRIVNPYLGGQTLQPTEEVQKVNFNILRKLIYAASVENLDALRRARMAIAAAAGDPARQRRLKAQLAQLPDNVATVEKMNLAAGLLKDPRKAHTLTAGWRDFFHENYERIAAGQ